MTNEIIATTISISYLLDNGDNLYISDTGGILFGSTTNVALRNATTSDVRLQVLIDGTVLSMSGGAIAFTGVTSSDVGLDRLVIGASGLVRSVSGFGVSTLRSSETVVNYGSIDAKSVGISMVGDSSLIRSFGLISAFQGAWMSGNGSKFINGGTIQAGASGVEISGTSTYFTNAGAIFSGGGLGVAQSNFLSAEFNNSGEIDAASGSAVLAFSSSDGRYHMVNSGLIHGRSLGLLFATGTGGSLNLINSGEISGNEAGIHARGGRLSMINTAGGRILATGVSAAIEFLGTLRLVNDGTIANAAASADDDGAIHTDNGASSARVINRGVISSTENAIDLRGDSGNSGALDLANTGAIIGAVFGGGGNNRVQNWGDMQAVTFGAGDDILRNHGIINGDVVLGDGANLFDQRDGAIQGEVFGGTGSDTFLGGSGDESFLGLDGNDILRGNGGDDALFGGLGRDRLIGGDGDDRLNGDYWFDTPTGGANSADIMTGGAGADVFVFQNAEYIGTSPATRDRITDFTHGEDRIDLSAFMAGGSFIGGAGFAGTGAAQVRYLAASGVLIGDVNGDGVGDWQIGLTANLVLSASDFLFV